MHVVVIPAYEPDEALCKIVEQLWETGCRVVVVDDGSGETYQSVFDRIRDICIILKNEKNDGKGVAIRTALSYISDEMADADTIGLMDADGQHLPEDMMKVLACVKQHPDALVLGVRSVDRRMPLRSRIGNWITRQVFHLATGMRVTDTQTGLRAFGRDLLLQMQTVRGQRYEYEMNVLAACAKNQIPIFEVPIHTIYRDRENSTSHFRVLRDSLRIYSNLFRFALVSFSSFLLDYVAFLLMVFLLPQGMTSVAIANVLARLISAAYNYCMNCHFVFSKRPGFETAVKYTVLACTILFFNNMILAFWMHLQLQPEMAKLLTEGSIFIVSFIVQKFLIFHEAERESMQQKKEVKI